MANYGSFENGELGKVKRDIRSKLSEGVWMSFKEVIDLADGNARLGLRAAGDVVRERKGVGIR